MPYISEFINTTIQDSSEKNIGKLKDVLIRPRAGTYAGLGYILVKNKKYKKDFFIPFEQVENLSNKEITLKNVFSESNIEHTVPPEHIFLIKDVLDQQIVDMGGARVVRVNDLKLGVFEGSMSVLGIDISFKGLLRRLGLTFIDFFKMMPSNLIDWRQAHPIKGALRLDTVSQNLTKLHPADLANIIEDLNIKQGGQLVTSLDEREAAKVLEEMDPHLKKILIKHMGPEKVGKIIERMSVDEAVDVIKTLSKDEARHFLSFLQEGKSKTVQKLLSHPNDTAGGLMTTDFVRVTPDWTVGDTIDEIRKISPSLRSLLYVYVTNKRDIFQGTVSLRRLLLAQSHQKISSIMKKTRATGNLRVHNKINEITTTMTKYNLYSAAVLDKKKRLVGIVTIDDIMRRIRPNA